LEIQTIPTNQVTPYGRNPRKNDGAVDKVAASIKAFGWRQPIVVDEDMVIIAGHTRLLAAKKLGINEVPVHVATGLTSTQVKAYRLADNLSLIHI
jgi:ParB-like chromosome segregation protein Spo0J